MVETTTTNEAQEYIAHIVAFDITNFKRIRRATKDDLKQMGLIRLLGENWQGKSSLLDAIFAGILGSKEAVCNDPIRLGEQNSKIKLTFLDSNNETFDIITTLTPNPKEARGFSHKLEAYYGDGRTMSRSAVVELIDRGTLNGVGFMELKEAEQVKVLQKIAPLALDLVAWKERMEAAKNRYTQAHAIETATKSKLNGLTSPSENLPTTISSTAEILVKHQIAAQKTAAHNKAAEQVDILTDQVAIDETAIKRAEEALAAAKARAEQTKVALSAAKATLSTTPKGDDPAIFAAELQAVEKQNEAIRKAEEYRILVKQLTDAQADMTTHKTTQATLEKERTAAFAGINLPYPGLAYTESGVMLNGHPFSEASGVQKIAASIAVEMVLKPTARVMRIKNSTYYSETTLQEMARVITDHRFQVFLELGDPRRADADSLFVEDGVILETV